jgi:hypothetical protein
MTNIFDSLRVPFDPPCFMICGICDKEIGCNEEACFGTNEVLCGECFDKDFDERFSRVDKTEFAGYILCTPLELQGNVFGPRRWYNEHTAYMVMEVYDKAVKKVLNEDAANGIWNEVCQVFQGKV